MAYAQELLALKAGLFHVKPESHCKNSNVVWLVTHKWIQKLRSNTVVIRGVLTFRQISIRIIGELL